VRLDPEKTAAFQFDRGPVGCLLIHGFTGSPFMFRELAQYLAERDVTVLCRQLPGHGTTPEEMSRTDWRDWYGASVASLVELSSKCEKVVVCGQSMGGTLSLHLAAHHASGNKVAGVITYGAPIYMKNPLLPFLPLIKPFVKYMHSPAPDVANLEARPEVLSYDRVPLRCIESLLDLLDHVRNDLRDVTVPVLLFQGVIDHVVDPPNVHLIHRLLGCDDKIVVELPNSCHMIPVDYDKELVKERTYEFVRRVTCA